MKPLAIKGTYSDLKLIKTRGVLQIVIEVPVHDQKAVIEVMGGYPVAGEEHWFAIAPLELKAQEIQKNEKPKRSFQDLPASQQAGIRCEDIVFSAFLQENYADEWHDLEADPAACVRSICNVGSRSDLDRQEKHANRVLWHQLNSQFEAWKIREQA